MIAHLTALILAAVLVVSTLGGLEKNTRAASASPPLKTLLVEFDAERDTAGIQTESLVTR